MSDRIETSPYNLQKMLNSADEDYLKELLRHTREIPVHQAIAGDIVLLFWGKCYSHGAILLAPWPGRMIHALNRFGVIETDASKDGRILATLRKSPDHPPKFFRPQKWD